MKTYKITIPGTPVITPRPRVLKSGITYTPARAKKKQAEIAEEWRRTHRIKFTGAVEIKAYFYFEPPKSWSKKKKKQALEGIVYPVSHVCGDIDNLLKTALDGLNGVAYVDDSQVVRAVVRMAYDTEARTEITIKALTERTV